MALCKPREGVESEKQAHQLLRRVALAVQEGNAALFAGYIETSAPFDIVFTSHGFFGGSFYRNPAVRSVLLPALAPDLPDPNLLAWVLTHTVELNAETDGRKRKKDLKRRLEFAERDCQALSSSHADLKFWVCAVDLDSGLQYSFGSIREVLKSAGFQDAVKEALSGGWVLPPAASCLLLRRQPSVLVVALLSFQHQPPTICL